MSDQKRADLARQEQAIAEGERKFQQMESNIYSKAGEDFQRRFFNMSRTERQMYGLPVKIYGSASTVRQPKRRYKPEAWSKCCLAEAHCWKSRTYGGVKEETWRCEQCYNDCEIQKTKPRKSKRKRST